MKKLLSLLMMAGVMASMISCSEDDGGSTDGDGDVTENVVKAGLISASETWSSDKIYELKGRVIVPSGVTLTIEAGTVVKGAEGQGSLASALIIAQGGKIMAEGTADEPIIFTSVLDEITVGGEYVGNLAKEVNETWGGLMVLGKAPISAKAGDDVSTIEGLPADEDYSAYGGSDAADNSGVIKYVSIRHGGITIGADNEINGLTLGGVGTGTTIENVEIYATLDDGIEFFGGTVNVKNALITWQGDDGVDIDQNYSGTVDNFVVYHGEGVETDEGLEIDGPENTLSDGKFTLKNGTLMSDGIEGSAADLKSDAQGTITNVVFKGYATGKGVLKIEGEYDANCDVSDDTDARGNFISGELAVSASTAEGVKLYSKQDDDKNPICASLPTADVDAVVAEFTSDATATGADTSVFGWTVTVKSGMTL
ncbi:hypothetical protein [Reichenbachiella agariperforans]|uniref:hypothetical protein n=1 Tax=Reichenbachiella agariperforans TaxID=156994 RepID=UPI001C0A1E5F|nr:hypothetical protein [Reichenbachiella agariperforans]MBU2915121.1 hypothetical protein [Reichenbachiella agariperforans]